MTIRARPCDSPAVRNLNIGARLRGLLQDLFAFAEAKALVAEEEAATRSLEGHHLVAARELLARRQLRVDGAVRRARRRRWRPSAWYTSSNATRWLARGSVPVPLAPPPVPPRHRPCPGCRRCPSARRGRARRAAGSGRARRAAGARRAVRRLEGVLAAEDLERLLGRRCGVVVVVAPGAVGDWWATVAAAPPGRPRRRRRTGAGARRRRRAPPRRETRPRTMKRAPVGVAEPRATLGLGGRRGGDGLGHQGVVVVVRRRAPTSSSSVVAGRGDRCAGRRRDRCRGAHEHAGGDRDVQPRRARGALGRRSARPSESITTRRESPLRRLTKSTTWK